MEENKYCILRRRHITSIEQELRNVSRVFTGELCMVDRQADVLAS